MKTSTYKYLSLSGVVVFLIGCSTKKDSFVNRNYHAVTTEYNVLYNGNLALDAGVEQLKTTYTDNFWELLPVERMQPVAPKEGSTPGPSGMSATVPSPAGGGEKKPVDPRGELESKVADVKGKVDSKIAQGKDMLSKAGIGGAAAQGANAPAKAADGRNPNFSRAEEKATKAIQKHAMNIGGRERNPQMDEAHLLLGKARYYENRYIPSLEAFNYILYKYPNSDKIFEAKVWREKTNLRLDNEAIAIKNLKLLLKEKDIDPQIFADANAMLAQAYIMSGAQDSAVAVLRTAATFTKQNEERARYHFILGQLYEKQNRPDSAFAEFQRVIDMKRKSPRRYVIQAHARQAAQFDPKKGDTLVFMEKYRKLLEDRENRPYLDVLNHQVALFYEKQGMDNEAITYYNKSLRTQSQDRYLVASNFRNIAEINFKNAKYPIAGSYYDSTLVNLDNRSREYNRIKKKRDNLADVIKYEGIAQTNDSILRIVALSDTERVRYFEDHIVKIKEQDEKERIRLEKEAIKAENQNAAPAADIFPDNMKKAIPGQKDLGPVNNTPGGAAAGKFYFYNPSTVSYGKLEFQKKWGKRALTENWRWSSEIKDDIKKDDETVADSVQQDIAQKDAKQDVRYSTDFYIKQLPTSQVVIDSLAKERNFAYYQLGSIYKEKFKEYQRAADKLEKLLVSNPEERLILPSKYNLYKIYEIIDPAKAEKYKQQILSQYPDSRYAEIIKNPAAEQNNSQSPEAVYDALYKLYEEGKAREAYAQVMQNINTYTGEEIVSKFELLKANIVGRLQGVEEYKKTLNFVALNYPNSEEGKKAEAMLKTDIPNLEKVAFGNPSMSWKIIFKFDNPEDPKMKPLVDKIQKYIKEGYNNNITMSNDIYTMTGNFIVIHGYNSKLAAEDAVTVLQDYKTYKITEAPYVISTEDYKVVQIKKNFTEFLAIK